MRDQIKELREEIAKLRERIAVLEAQAPIGIYPVAPIVYPHPQYVPPLTIPYWSPPFEIIC